MIQHTGALLYLEEWSAAVKADVYEVGNARVLNLAGNGDEMIYDVSRDECDYVVHRVEDRFRSTMTVKRQHIASLSDHAKELAAPFDQ